MLQDFRTFIARGNVIDLAVGIVIGAAFATVVDSFVKDVLMPPIGLLTGGVNFSELYLNLSGQSYPSLAAATEAGAPLIRYGVFLNNLVTFLIVGFAVFMVVRAYNRLRTPQTVPAAPIGKECPFCRESIAQAATRCPHCTSELAAAASPALPR